MRDKLKATQIKLFFGDKPFTSDELYHFYALDESDLNKGTFRWRVYYLKNEGVIRTIKRGVYSTITKEEFKPVINKQLKQLFLKIKKKFPYSDLCIWETSWLNNYMVHQAFSSNIIIEVEKEAAQAVFAYLQESSKDVYLNPGKHEIDTYILSAHKNIIVKNLNLTSPVTQREDIVVPTIEKIMIDIFAENELFITYQGEEIKNIYREFFRTYNINQSTLRQYANKRHIKDKLITFLKEEIDNMNEKIII